MNSPLPKHATADYGPACYDDHANYASPQRRREPTIREQTNDVQDAIWIRDEWLRECHSRIRILNAVLQEWGIVHAAMLHADEVLPGELR